MTPASTLSPRARTRRPACTTARFDAVACLDHRVRRLGDWIEPVDPGRYIQVQGVDDATFLIPLQGNIVRVGRSLAADIHLDDDSVSRRHAVLVLHANGARILDDRSANGTFLNGRRVVRTDLADGDLVTLGRFVLRYRAIAQTATPLAAHAA
jgi:pSer/pThr/pTyr-binding forkhead associated (FHA) protein